MARLISQKIDVEYEEQSGNKVPSAFKWRNKQFRISRIIAKWKGQSSGMVAPQRPHWWEKSHVVYYQVETEEGSQYEICWDKTSKKREWLLHRKL